MANSTPYTIPPNKIYAVIELTRGGTPYACIAPSLWLHDVELIDEDDAFTKVGFCHWPNNEAKLSDYVQNRKRPDTTSDKWTVHKVIILKLCVSLKDAKSCSETALDKSFLSSTDPEVEISKRKTVARNIFDALNNERSLKSRKSVQAAEKETGSSADSEEYDIQIEASNKTRFSGDQPGDSYPSKRMRVESESQEKQLNDIGDKSGIGNTESVPEKLPNTAHSNAPTEDSGSVRTSTPNTKEAPVVAVTEASPIASTSAANGSTLLRRSPRKNPTPRKLLTSPATDGSIAKNGSTAKNGGSTAKKPFLRTHKSNDGHKCAQAIADLHKIIFGMDRKLDRIAIAVSPHIDESAASDDYNIPALPIQDEDKEADFIEFVADPVNSAILVKHLSSYGSSTGRRQTVYGILSKLMSNKLAASYNFKGKNKSGAAVPKKAFEKSRLNNILLAAIKGFVDKLPKPFETGNSDLKTDIMAWLKDAPKRLKQELLELEEANA